MALIKNYENYDVQSDGVITSYKFKNSRVLKPQRATQSKKGYYQVRLFNKSTPKGKLHYIHRIVWESFIGEIPEGLEIDHKNGDTTNNSLDNLQLITKQENQKKYQLERFGKIIRDQRDELIKDYLELGSFQKVADKWNVNVISVYRVVKNKVATRNGGKHTVKDFDKDFSDGFTQFDLRNDDVREQLGLPKINKNKKK